MHPLEGPRLKIGRAQDQIEILNNTEVAFRKATNCQVGKAEINPQTGKQVYRLVNGVFPDPLWGVLVGEIVHDLRSALDNLVWQLALSNPGVTTPAPRTQFPIFLYGHTKRSLWARRGEHSFWGKQRGDGRDLLLSIAGKYRIALERFQPYKRGGEGRRNLLYLLRELNNADKHRLIQVLGATFGAGHYGVGNGSVDDVDISLFVMLEAGAKVAEAPPHADLDISVMPGVTFWEGCAAVKGRPVVSTLRNIAQHAATVVESFAPELVRHSDMP